MGGHLKTFGISVALLTPYGADGAIDRDRFVQHANYVLQNGAKSVTLFGTTGEGASLGDDERNAVMDAVLASDVPTDKMICGVCANSVVGAAAQMTAGLDRGIDTFLVPPPFFFKGCSDDGLFHWYADLLAKVGPRAQVILYHIPQVTGVPLSLSLVRRLVEAFPDQIAGVKDSSGNWENAEQLLAANIVPILVGDERLLHRAAQLGAAGSICGMANLYPGRLKTLFETATEDRALSEEVTRVVSGPVIPALKHLIAKMHNAPEWERVRAPLANLNDKEIAALMATEESAA